MSTELLNENQRSLYDALRHFESLGGSEGYLASLEAAKTSNAPSLPDIAPGNPQGKVIITIAALPWPETYSVTVVIETPPGGPTYTGYGVFHGPLKPGTYPAEWMVIEGAQLDDLLPSLTPCSWYSVPNGLVGMVFSQGNQPLVHILNGPPDTGLENNTIPLKWTKRVVG